MFNIASNFRWEKIEYIIEINKKKVDIQMGNERDIFFMNFHNRDIFFKNILLELYRRSQLNQYCGKSIENSGKQLRKT